MPYKNKLERGLGCLLAAAGVPFAYEPDRIYYTKPHYYVPDFKVGDFYLETKGRFLPSDRTKHLLLQEQHPELDIRFVFQQPTHRISKVSRTTYAAWCDKHGFLWCGKKLPKEWF